MKKVAKKAIELSINFLVMLILSIVIFGFGIAFIYNTITNSENLRDMTLEELDDQIEDLLCESADKVCLGINTQTMEKGDVHIFGVKVINIDDVEPDHSFTVYVEESGYISKDGIYSSLFPSITDIDAKPQKRTEKIEAHEEKDMGIGFHLKNAAAGKYIFTVYSCYDGSSGTACPATGSGSSDYQYDSPKKIYINVP